MGASSNKSSQLPSQPLKSIVSRALAFQIKVRLSRDLLELGGVKRTHGFRVDVALSSKLGDAMQNFPFLAAQNKNPVTGTSGPELAFHFHSRFFGGFYECSPAFSAFPDVTGTLTGEMNQGHISRHNFSFGLVWYYRML
jgi:hypothetical protein